MKLLKIILFIFFIGFYNSTFAIDAPQNLVLDNSADTEISISWDAVEGSEVVYGISYGMESGIENGYEFDQEVAVVENNAIIENLEPNTNYYIAVKAYNSENEESEYSEEFTFSTTGEIIGLKVDEIEVKDTRTLSLDFNVNLNEDSLVDVNIVDKEDDLVIIDIEKYEINGNNLELFLTEEFTRLNKYSITIINIEGNNGEKINVGIEGIVEFEVGEDVPDYKEEIIDDTDLNSANNNQDENDDDGLVNIIDSAFDDFLEDDNQETELASAGNNDNDEGIITESVAKDKEDLPETGPTETLLFLIFSLIAGFLFFILRRKTSH